MFHRDNKYWEDFKNSLKFWDNQSLLDAYFSKRDVSDFELKEISDLGR